MQWCAFPGIRTLGLGSSVAITMPGDAGSIPDGAIACWETDALKLLDGQTLWIKGSTRRPPGDSRGRGPLRSHDTNYCEQSASSFAKEIHQNTQTTLKH